MCGLRAYADAIVGSLNVEYQKRTTIAVELVAKVSADFFHGLLRAYGEHSRAFFCSWMSQRQALTPRVLGLSLRSFAN